MNKKRSRATVRREDQADPTPDSPVVTVNHDLELQGYVLDEATLRKLHGSAFGAVFPKTAPTEEDALALSLRPEASTEIEFADIDQLVTRIGEEVKSPRSLSLEYVRSKQAGIEIRFDDRGAISLTGFGSDPDFQFNMDRLLNICKETERSYSAFVRGALFSFRMRRVVAVLITLLSLFVLGNVVLYAYGSRFGVDIDPSVVPAGYTWAEEIEAAVRSDSVSVKLNTILRSQLRGFTNISTILADTRGRILWSLVSLIIFVAAAIILRALGRLYPRGFIAIGRLKETLERMTRRREIWYVGIVIGFLVNIAAGVIVAWAFR